MLIHLFLALQKSIKRPCYSNNITFFFILAKKPIDLDSSS